MTNETKKKIEDLIRKHPELATKLLYDGATDSIYVALAVEEYFSLKKDK